MQYLVLEYTPHDRNLTIEHFSPGIIDMLHLNLPNGSIAPVQNKDIFVVLIDNSSSASSTSKYLKNTVRGAIRVGRAVSIEIGLMTGYEQKKSTGWLGGGSHSTRNQLRKVEEKYVSHWTPLKNEEGNTKKVVLTIVPKL
jgi:hypothetical protein